MLLLPNRVYGLIV